LAYRKKARTKSTNAPKSKPRNMVKAPLCPYCGKRSKLMKGKDALRNDIGELRPDLANKLCYVCLDCDARVWCHDHSGEALGKLANRHCRLLRKIGHKKFDQLWKDGGKMERDQAYDWMAKQLGLTRRQCHFGMFDEAMCKRAIDLLEQHKTE
jgi:hypothetical protein